MISVKAHILISKKGKGSYVVYRDKPVLLHNLDKAKLN